jgi:hypothetical protein
MLFDKPTPRHDSRRRVIQLYFDPLLIGFQPISTDLALNRGHAERGLEGGAGASLRPAPSQT